VLGESRAAFRASESEPWARMKYLADSPPFWS
jgi:hypothetical protein